MSELPWNVSEPMGKGLAEVVSPVHAVVTEPFRSADDANPGRSGITSFWRSSGEPLSGVQQIGLDSWWDGCGNETRSVVLIKINVEACRRAWMSSSSTMATTCLYICTSATAWARSSN